MHGRVAHVLHIKTFASLTKMLMNSVLFLLFKKKKHKTTAVQRVGATQYLLRGLVV